MHERFWVELAGRMGPPVFAATLVGCLLEGRFSPTHGVLLAIGFGLVGLHHFVTQHRSR